MRGVAVVCGLMIFMIGVHTGLLAQISQEGTPPSFSLQTLKTDVPVEVMRKIELEKLIQEDEITDQIKDIPWRFGENIDVVINPENSGVWDTIEGRGKLWRTSIYSPGAHSINLTFNKYFLAPGAQLYIYNSNRTMILGAFTELNNQEDGFFATTLVSGEHITIEYFEPEGTEIKGELNISMVTHAYRSPMDYAKNFGQSGWCNLNVVCDQIKGWENVVRSVAMMITGGNSLCTGALINNTSNPGEPLFLSANHCAFNPSTVVLWFNWQSLTCDNPPEAPPYYTMSGAAELARAAQSDFLLLRLNQPVPLEYNPYFAGWNRSTDSIISGPVVGIHHPRGDIKKLSYASTGVASSDFGSSFNIGRSHWRINWSGGTTTEPGSSGSPLFDANAKIIGQLHGGAAACGNTEADWYGRLGESWEGEGTSQTQLSTWLDPLKSGVMEIEGYDPVADIIDNPSQFVAIPASETSLKLSWKPDTFNNKVIIAVNSENIFGTPTGTYSLNQEINGGGTIIYMGTEEEFTHQHLEKGRIYYYKVWSNTMQKLYSGGIITHGTIPCETITSLPFMYGFNSSDNVNCWQQTIESGNLLWQVRLSTSSDFPAAVEGPGYINFSATNDSEDFSTTKLISPTLNLQGKEDVHLSFWYINQAREQQNDELRIWSRTAADQPWEFLGSFSSHQPQWVQATIKLDNISEEFQVAFEGKSQMGNGIGIDAVRIHTGNPDVHNPAITLEAKIENKNKVDLFWQISPNDSSQTKKPKSFLLYRNNKLISTLPYETQHRFRDENLPVGSYTWEVQAWYQENYYSDPSNSVVAEITGGINDKSLKISINGNGNTSIDSGSYNFQYATKLQIEPYANEGWHFSHWNLNSEYYSDTAELNLEMKNNYHAEAVFKVSRYNVGVIADPPEAVTALTGAGEFNYGDFTHLAFETVPEYTFSHWSSGSTIVSLTDKYLLKIVSDTVLKAHFTIKSLQLNLLAEPYNGGKVLGSGLYSIGAQVEVQAEPEPGWSFRHWSVMADNNYIILSDEPAYSFNIKNNITLRAHFEPLEFPVTIEIEGVGTTLPAPGEHIFAYGIKVPLIPMAGENWGFEKWVINGLEIKEAHHTITVEGPVTVKAYFHPVTPLQKNQKVVPIHIYPIPSSQYVSVVVPTAGTWRVGIYNLSGHLLREVYSTTDTKGVFSLNISNLRPGIYMLRAINWTGSYTGKFLKE